MRRGVARFWWLLAGLLVPAAASADGPPAVGLTMTVRSDAPGRGFVPGAEVVYSLRLTNAGVADSPALTLTDRVPPELTITGAQSVGGVASVSPDGRDVRIAGLVVPAGRVLDVTLRAVIGDVAALAAAGHPFAALDGLIIAHQAEVIDPGDILGTPRLSDDPGTMAADDPTAFVLSATVDLSSSAKSGEDVNGGALEPGDRVRYTLTLTNAGSVATPVIVDDPVPGGLGPCEAVDVPAGLTCDASGLLGTVDVPAQGEVTVVFEMQVAADAADGSRISNLADLQSTLDPRATLRVASDPLPVTVPPPPVALVATKTLVPAADGAYSAGDDVTYTLTVANPGRVASERLEIIDPLDENLTGTFAEGGMIDAAGRSAAFTLAPIPPGGRVELELRAVIGADVAAGTRIFNQYGVRPVGQGAFQPSDNPETAAIDDQVVFAVAAPPVVLPEVLCDLGWTRPEGVPPAPGESLTYELTCVNVGQTAARTLRMFDSLPPELSYVPGSTAVGARAIADAAGGAAPSIEGFELLEAMPLRPGNAVSATLSATVRPGVAAGTRVSNQAVVIVDGELRVLSDDPSTRETSDATIFRVAEPGMTGAPDLTNFRKTFRVLDVDDPTRAKIGDVVEFTLVAQNVGTLPAAGLSLIDPLPPRTRYVPGSLTSDGRPLSDAIDPDSGEVDAQNVTVSRPTLGPRESWGVTFRVTVLEGPLVQNQARLLAQGQRPQISDNDGNEANGNGPTVVPVGEGPVSAVSVTKTVERSPDGRSAAFAIAVQNTGTVALSALDFVDELPRGLSLDLVTAASDGLRLEVGDSTRLAGVIEHLPPGGRVVLGFTTMVDPSLPDGMSLCNFARVTGRGLVAASPPACFLVEAQLGELHGVVYQDLDATPDFQANRDFTFGGTTVRVLGESAVNETRVDADGTYELAGIVRGDVELQVLNQTGTVLLRQRGVRVEPGRARRDLAVVPSGRVYESQTGALKDGVRLYLYRDRDLDADVFDDQTRDRRLLVPAADLESGTQQGQLSGPGGVYRFAPTRPGRYFLSAEVPGALVFPSVLRPTRDGFIPPGKRTVAETALPAVVEGEADGPPWSIAFESDGRTHLAQNHLPLDPLSALLEVQKRSLRGEASVGDVVTYEIDVFNRSSAALRYDPRANRGGVYVQDRLPTGFKYVAGSAVLMRVGERAEQTLAADDPAGADILRFGQLQAVNGRSVLRPLTLGAGAHLRLRYQLVVGANVRPKEVYRNRAQLLSSDGTPLTDEARADVVIVADPELDQSVLLGKVFCDADSDGEQGAGEVGLPGALVLADSGDFAVTDSAGKFHFQTLDAGTHAFKVDSDSLLPGAVLTTDETRILSLTRGLPAKLAFGVTCPAETADSPALELAPEGMAAALASLRRRAVVVTGNVRALRARVDGQEVLGGATEVQLMADSLPLVAPDLRPGGLGVTAELAFRTRVPAGAPSERWALWLGPLGGEEGVIETGKGPPPELIPWAQTGPTGERVLEKGRVYAFRLEVSDAEGRLWGSPAGVFGVGAQMEPEPPLIASVRGALFAENDTDLPLLERELRRLLPRLRKANGAIRVEVHGDDAQAPAEMLARTQRQAGAAATRLRALLGGEAGRVVEVGMGTARPLAPNLSERQRARNRRLELRAVPSGTVSANAPPRRTIELRAAYAAVARAGRDEAAADAQGEFGLTTAVPEDGVVELAMRDVDGRRSVVPVRLHAGAPAAVGAPRVLVLAGTPPDGLTLDGVPLRLPDGTLSLSAGGRLEADSDGRLRPLTLKAGGGAGIAQWSASVVSASGREMLRREGVGDVPGELTLSGGAPPWSAGEYSVWLTARRSDGAVLQSAPLRLKVGPGGPAPAPAGAWQVFLDGRPVRMDAAGHVFGETVLRDGGATLVEVESPTGARVAFFARPGRTGASEPLPAPVKPAVVGASSPHVLGVDGPVAAPADPGHATPEAAAASNPTAPPSTQATASDASAYPKMPPTGATPSDSGPYRRVEEPLAPGEAAPVYARVDELSGPGSAAPEAYRRIDELIAGSPPPPTGPPPVDGHGLHDYPPGTPPPASPPPAPRTPLNAAARSELDSFCRAELMRALAPSLNGAGADVPARKLSVTLPAAGAALAGRSVPIRGTTDPENRVFVNGVELPVGAEGQFGGAALFPPGVEALEIATLDAQGNRGVIRREMRPANAQWFLLALGDSAAGQRGSELDGTTSDTRVDVGDSVYLHGRGAAWLRGRVQGKEILDGAFSEYEVEAHLDTARRRRYEPAFQSLIDPEATYPTYGDSSTLENPIHTRGPVYVLVRADDSRITVGDFASDVRGLELMRYDRSLYGAQLKLDKEVGLDARWHHEANAFVADLDAPERHAYVELRGTGGSLYYLPFEALIEGTERVYLIERDRETGIERGRKTLLRDVDYSIRYREGRILMKSPIPRATLDAYGPAPQVVNGRRGEVLGGHPVYLAVEMDHRDPQTQGDVALGAHVRETFARTLTLGGGYLEEGQSRDARSRYKLWGAEAAVHHGRRSRVEAEWVQSRNGLGTSLFSEDGGLTYEPFHARNGEGAKGTGLLLRGGLELDDLIGEADRDHWYTEGYWQYLAPGFYSGGTVQSQGLEKYGALTRYVVNESHALRLQFDAVVADEPETQGPASFHGFRRSTTLVGHTYTDGPLMLDTTLSHTEDDEGLVGGERQPPFVTDVLNVGAEYELTSKWTLLAGQEVVVRGDARIHESTSDLLATTVGARYRPIADVSIEGTETVRYSGDNATQIGLRTEVDDRHTVYVNERFAHSDGRAGATSVVGGEERWGDDQSGRSYGEYQLEAGELGARNRAILGLGKRTKVSRGLTLDAGYERSQVLGGPENGEMSSDTVSLGSEWLKAKRVKLAGRYELRYDDNSEDVGRRDRLQFLALNGADWILTPDFTFLVRLNYSQTFDLGLEGTEAELVEGSLGLAFRPVTWDDLAALVKYTKRYEQRPTDLLVELPIRDEYDVIALVPMLELPWHFQIVEKVALKRMATRTLNLPTVVSQTLLWINRLNYHVTETWDAGVEYRFLKTTLAQSQLHGALAEINYIIQKKVRLGVGYNFTSFSDDEFARLDENHGGPFFRVVANY